MVSSCCGLMSLQRACVITATLEIISAGVFLLINSVTLVVETPLAIAERDNAIEEDDPYRFHAIRLVLCGVNTCFWVGCLFLGMILLVGSKQRDLRRLRSWYILTCILTVLFIVDIFMEAFSMLAPTIAIVSPTFGTILQCYMLWIVTDFMEEVARNGCTLPIKTSMEEHD